MIEGSMAKEGTPWPELGFAGRYGIALASVSLVLTVHWVLGDSAGRYVLNSLFTLVVLVSAVLGGPGPGLLALAAGGAANVFPAVKAEPGLNAAQGTVLIVWLAANSGVIWMSTLLREAGRRAQRSNTQTLEAARELGESTKRKDETLALLDTLLVTAPVGLGFVDRDLRYV
ncbi:MAG: hypothetical protein ACRD7E_28515, partial [Bryobacteraceae bacterium]